MKYLFSFILSVNSMLLTAQQKLIKVNQSNNSPEETSIAINPVKPWQVAASSNINNYYYSINSGKSWHEKPMNSQNGIWGDPMVHFDNTGNLYYAHLGRNPEKYFPNYIDKMVVQRINVKYDTCFSDVSLGFNANKVQDKEWLSTNAAGHVYLTWTEFDKYASRNSRDHSRIRFSKSIDKGSTWTKPIVISDKEGDCLDGDSTMEGATSCSDSKGNIYVCWSGINKIWFDKSRDSGKTFGRDKIIAEQTEGWNLPVKNIYRSNGMPFLLCDNSNRHFKDRLYANWSDTRNGDADVFIKYSDDEGETWSRDIRVNDDKEGNGADQFCNNFCIDASTGNVYVVFYDKRNSSTGAYIDVYIACSKNGGNTWENTRITSRPFTAPGKTVFFGDYIGIDAVNGNVMPIYTVNEKNKFTVYTTLLDTSSARDYHLKEDLQVVNLNDSFYIHLLFPKNKKCKLTMSVKGISKVLPLNHLTDEQDFSINAKGIHEAEFTLRYGLKRKTIKVFESD